MMGDKEIGEIGEIDARLEIAVALAQAAGQRALDFFRSDRLQTRFKGIADPVTAADLAADRLICDAIRRAFPNDGILSEESGGDASGILWVIDPIDGTQNFARGIARFAVSIAVCRDGRPVCGAIFDPVAGEMFSARENGGAFLNGIPIQVSVTTAPEAALVEAGYAAKHGHLAWLRAAEQMLAAGFGVRQSGSAALGLAEVACGRIDGYWEARLEPWDVAAASVLVREAGGRISDFFAGDGLRTGGPILAAAPGVWEALRATITPDTRPRAGNVEGDGRNAADCRQHAGATGDAAAPASSPALRLSGQAG